MTQMSPVQVPFPAYPTDEPAVVDSGSAPARDLRHAVRRLLAKPALRAYNRWIALVLLVNAALLVARAVGAGTVLPGEADALAGIALIAQLNLTVSSLIRQQHIVNLLAWLATRVPTSWPLSIRRALAKVHHLGGIHVGGAVSGTGWYLLFVAGLLRAAWDGQPVSGLNLGLSTVIVVLLLGIIVLALPGMRRRWHDLFEATHRLGGWTVLALVWLNAVAFVASTRGSRPMLSALASSPTVALIVLTTASAALPWLRLRRVRVEVERPSRHAAIVRLHHRVRPGIGSARAISRSPIMGWHSFANMPLPVGESGKGYRMVISRAGDWTGEFIDNPPTHVWVRGEPVTGMANCRKLFGKVLFVATGSGIGPILGHVVADAGAGHLIWVTRTPRQTYGDDLIEEILTAQPDATVWDTTERGKPDLLPLCLAGVAETGAEAVIVISNQAATWRVVEGLEQRGIPAYGAIWDS